MAINSKFNTAIMLDGGSGKPTTPTYGSYLSGSTPSPSVPTPITLPSYSAGLIGQPTVPVSPIGNTVKMPNMNFNSNVVQVGAAQNKGNGGITDEGVVIGGGATPLPQIKSGGSGGSSGSGSSGSAGASTYGSWLQNIVNKVGGAVANAANGVNNWLQNAAQNAQNATNNQKTTLVHNPNEEVTKTTLPAQAGQSVEKTPLSETGGSTGTGTAGTGAATEQKAYAGAWAGSEPIDSYEEFLRNKESAYGSMRDEQTQFYDAQSQKALEAIEAQRQAAIAEANNQKTMVDTAATEQKNAALAEAQAQKDLLTTMSQEQRDAVYKFAEEQRISDMNYAAQQYQLLLNSINAQRESGMAMATEQRDLLLSMSEEQRQAAYKHAEEQRASATAYANSQYQTLVDAINAQKESGMAMAEEQRQLLLSMSEEQRNAIYAAAESQRVAAEQRADVERERGVVDARSSYEQNKASYGANAEAMGSMGLSGSGYSDYLNSKAYAQQRAETQAANAQADASKREARYTEDQARLQADSDYYQNKYNAEQAYSDRKYQIDTTYQTNMLNAEQNKAQSIYEAESAERDAKYSADSAHAQNEYSAEAQYSQNKYEVDTTYQNNLLGANQSKAQAEHEATSAERESKFNADQAHAQNQYAAESGYSQSKYEAESAERDAKLQAGLSYSENLFNAESQARSDKLAAEQTADAGKFSAEMSYQENLLNNDDAIGAYRQEQAEKAEAEAKQAAAEAEEKASYATNAFYQFLGEAKSGLYSVEEVTQLADDYGMSPEQKAKLVEAVNTYETTKTNAENKASSDNLKDVQAQSNYDPSTFTQEDYDKMGEEGGSLTPEDAAAAKEYQNRNVYNGVVDKLNSGNVENIAGAFKDAETLYRDGNIDKATYDEIQSLMNTTAQGINYQYDSGKITASEYVKKMTSIGAGSSNKVTGGWFIEGLGTGRENDDVDITIGSTSRNKDTEFDLLCGATVTDSATKSALNKLATGSASKTPSIDGEGSGWFFGVGADTSISSDDKPGKIVCYNGKLYLYGKKNGWVELKSDNNQGDIDKAIAAFLKSTSASNIKGKTSSTSSGGG